MKGQIEGQISMFEYLDSLPKECSFSGHTCNKKNLWEVADTLDELQCSHVCCRKCNTMLCGARCNGSEEPTRIYQIDIRGLLDDGYCPKCGYAFKDWLGEVDCDCPECKAKIDWSRWHILNDISSN